LGQYEGQGRERKVLELTALTKRRGSIKEKVILRFGK